MRYLLLLIILGTMLPCSAQITEPDGGGGMDAGTNVSDELNAAEHAAVVSRLLANEQRLRREGLLPEAFAPLVTLFQWPVVQAPGFHENGFFGISNYVDNNLAFPGQVQDYNCGSRSYDLNSGYNHKGTDIFTWPFPWQKMAQNAVQIVAAAAGTIIGKDNGFSDQSCALCAGCAWNAVYVMHADGSVAWYGHMKLNSLTAKLVGQTVTAGEYLGIVGSSGNSTGPHLHFEVYTSNSYTQLVDPWAGPCNNFNGLTSWWAVQQPYFVSTLNKVMTHSAAPAMPGCPAGEATNEKRSFVNGETVILGGFYRDQQVGQQAFHAIYRPDNSLYSSWVQNFNINYSGSYWYYSRVLPNPAPSGMWRYEVIYNAQPPLATYFGVNVSGYQFIGNGNWSLPSNWAGNAIPPATLPAESEIIISPAAAGECFLDQVQEISTGAKITVAAGKRFRINGNLFVQ